MICRCRKCGNKYDSQKARGEWKGYCSAKCQHGMARSLGYRPRRHTNDTRPTEYQILHNHKAIGDIPWED